jgi:two-component system, NarL family, invasion response regulator UvrY
MIDLPMADLFLVDDHTLMRDGLRALLQARGHHVVGEASSRSEALAALPTLRADLMLLDLNLGSESGMDLLAEMQRQKHGTRVVVLTMSAQPRHVAQAQRLGALAYVLKGAAADELMLAIDHGLQGRPYLSPEVAGLANQGKGLAGQDRDISDLSARERQILLLVVQGHSSTTIGTQLALSPKTVDSYRARLMAKMAVPDVAALVRLALREGLISSDPS